MGMGLLIDSTRCIGCGACSSACKEQNKLPEKVEEVLTAYTWTVVQPKEGLNVRRFCMHCEVPTCASVCPVAALTEDARGPGGLRCRALHGLSLLHDGLSLPDPEVPVGPPGSGHGEVHPVRRTG